MVFATILLISSYTSFILFVVTVCFIAWLISEQNVKIYLSKWSDLSFSEIIGLFKKERMIDINQNLKVDAPGPRGFPIIGNLLELDGYEVPYQAFDVLAAKYGPIIKLKLGSVPTLIVNGIENIKEVLIYKGKHFDSRPNFKRYHQLFSGNKENSLAFCDWSDTQRVRREMLVPHSFPRNFSVRFTQLNEITLEHLQFMVDDIKMQMDQHKSVAIKPLIMQMCANVFVQYFTSRTFERNNSLFAKMIDNFDVIFYEVNQGYAADFLPFLLPFHRKKLKQMKKSSEEIRNFIMENIIEDRFEAWNVGNDPNDYIDSLIDHVKRDMQPKIEWDTAIFALEDIIGGHSAVGNFIVKVLSYVAQEKEVQKNIQAEIQHLLSSRVGSSISMSDRGKMMPYTEAVILETLRLISSPIVPHVASQDSTLSGYSVEKGTLIFLNNYNLSMSETLWENPTKFNPQRFLQDGRLVKPDHFIPFGNGARSCMGYKMVQLITFSVLANLLKDFEISPKNDISFKVPTGSLALPTNPYNFKFNPSY